MPLVPATWEAETGGSHEPGSLRLQRAVIVPLHSSWEKEQDCAWKKRRKGTGGEGKREREKEERKEVREGGRGM